MPRQTCGLVWLLSVLVISFGAVPSHGEDSARPAPLALRSVQLPEEAGHPIDRWLGTTQSPVIEDAVFARRVSLDLTGLLPAPEQLQVFVCDPAPGKREALVRDLLGDDQLYADHWITFWQDLLRDGKLDVGSTDVFQPITVWLRQTLEANTAYDAMARELVNPTDLEARGLLDRTLVILATEFGRCSLGRGGNSWTKLEKSNQYGVHGHFAGAASLLMWGGGIKPGVVVGKTADEFPCETVERPVSISDLHATIYNRLGIAPDFHVEVERRPFHVTKDGLGRPIEEILGEISS